MQRLDAILAMFCRTIDMSDICQCRFKTHRTLNSNNILGEIIETR